MEEKSKFECIIDAAAMNARTRKPQGPNEEYFLWTSSRNYDAMCTLSSIIARLTSADKTEREMAKKEVRELVKIGKEIPR